DEAPCGKGCASQRSCLWSSSPSWLMAAHCKPLSTPIGLDERTVASWRDRAGTHCQGVHQALIEQGKLDLVHVQADEIRVKGRSMIAWMGLTLMVSTRLWLGGAVSLTRDKALADLLMRQVRACAQALCAVLGSGEQQSIFRR